MSSITYVAYCSNNGKNECSGNLYETRVSPCNTCISGCDASCQALFSFTIQKRIQKQTGVSSSTYNNNLVPYQVTKNQGNYKSQGLPNFASQASDRNKPSGLTSRHQIINRNTSSLHGSRTSLKPGSLAPPNNGVDVKHGSYDRHLAKLKAKSLKPRSSTINQNPTYGNKQNNISIFNYGTYTNNLCNTSTPC